MEILITSVAALPLPRSIYIEPTSRCNELCQQCPRTLLSREEDRDLSFDEFRYGKTHYLESGLENAEAARG